MAARKGKVGRLPSGRVNVFNGLLVSALDGGTLQMADKGKKKSAGRVLVPYKGVQGVEGAKATSFPFAVFEKAVLSCLREIDPRDILPGEGGGDDKAQELAGRLTELEAEIEKVKARLQARYTDALADVLERQEAEQKALTEQLTQANQEAAAPLSAAWEECGSLFDAIEAAPDAEEARVRLRGCLRRVVEGIWCVFVGRGSRRLAAVQVFFTGGARRNYLILHKPATGGSVGVQPARWWARSLAEVAAPGDLDLRNPEHAKELEAVLATLPLEDGAAS
jgi:hypothetical protein